MRRRTTKWPCLNVGIIVLGIVCIMDRRRLGIPTTPALSIKCCNGLGVALIGPLVIYFFRIHSGLFYFFPEQLQRDRGGAWNCIY